MGYLNNASVTVDAILTTTGRQKLAAGSTDGLGIAYFALGDDEIDYDLWNPAHPLGSDYYGIVIENMPVLEASPIPEQNLKSKLITLAKGTTTIATVVATPLAIPVGTFRIDPATGNSFYQGKGVNGISISLGLSATNANNNILGYTVLSDSRYFTVVSTSAQLPGSSFTGFNLGDASSLTSTVVSNSFILYVKPSAVWNDFNGISTTLNIFVQGNEVGGRTTIAVPITIG
jgi:hypothetical protein